MMIAISILLFLIGLCVITMSYAYVQKMAVKLAGFLVEAPVTSAYVIPVEDNTGRVMNEKGKAYIGNKSAEVGIWPVHYPDKTIRLAARAAGVHTIFLRPKCPITLSKVVITKQADKAALGTWMLRKAAAWNVKHKGIAERRRYKHLPAQVPKYHADGCFQVSFRDHPMMNEPSTSVRNEHHEKLCRASAKALTDHNNRLLNAPCKDYKMLMVSCQRPKSAHILKEVGKKSRKPIIQKTSKIALDITYGLS